MANGKLPQFDVQKIGQSSVAILAVDDIKVSRRGLELLNHCVSGQMTFAQARDEIRARAMKLANGGKISVGK